MSTNVINDIALVDERTKQCQFIPGMCPKLPELLGYEIIFIGQNGSESRLDEHDVVTSLICKHLVIAHPTPANASTGSFVDSTKRMVSNTEALLSFAVPTTERKAA